MWLIKGFFDSIPMSLDEAADGRRRQPRADVLPDHPAAGHADPGRLRPAGLRRRSIGEFLLASIFLTDNNKKTLATGLYGLIDGDRSNNLGVFAAGALMTAIPVILLFLYLQRFIVGGITAGGVKG